MTDRDTHDTPRGGHPAPGGAPVPNMAALVDALQQLSTLLLLTAEAVDNAVTALTGQEPDTAPDTWPDTARPKLAIVRPVDEPSPPAPYDESPVRADPYPAPHRTGPGTETTAPHPGYVRDVEPLKSGRYRARVRWLDPQTKRYRSRSKNFEDQAAAWSWANRWAPRAEH